MNDQPRTAPWVEANQRFLAQELNDLSARLSPGDPPPPPSGEIVELAPSALDFLAEAFGLSAFERAILLLCAGVEMDSRFAHSCANPAGNPGATFALALATLDAPHWSALAPDRPLRRWRMIEIDPGPSLTASLLRIDERILHFLAGLNVADARVTPLVTRHEPPELMAEAHRALSERLANAWRLQTGVKPVIHLFGEDLMGADDIAAAVAARLGLGLYIVAAEDLPATPTELDGFATLWQREAVLLAAALLIQCGENAASAPVMALGDKITTPLFLSARDPQHLHRVMQIHDVRKPGATEQKRLWQQALGMDCGPIDDALDGIASQYRLSARAIGLAGQGVSDNVAAGTAMREALWQACRGSGRRRLDELATRIEPGAGWDDLILPEPQRLVLRQIAAQVRQRRRVYDEWGFGKRHERGLGVAALFSGESGTGKTLAAEVLASELHLDLYRIDLSAVVSKYIGESEKNLRRVFDAAEDTGAILLFDEADALFGKRSDVKDSHDRYANIEVSYLLQRMEAYRGLAILTTNLKSALDPAFQRRLRFIVHFPFPDASQREAIWRRAFPPDTPVDNLDFRNLSRLNVAGGGVRNISLNAAFLAAEAGEKLAMRHLLAAAHADRAKQDRQVADTETRGWL
jgi:ATPase family protein associated with various cellular activities (AAA)/winged helix domain-containing protein